MQICLAKGFWVFLLARLRPLALDLMQFVVWAKFLVLLSQPTLHHRLSSDLIKSLWQRILRSVAERRLYFLIIAPTILVFPFIGCFVGVFLFCCSFPDLEPYPPIAFHLNSQTFAYRYSLLRLYAFSNFSSPNFSFPLLFRLGAWNKDGMFAARAPYLLICFSLTASSYPASPPISVCVKFFT